MPSTATLLCGVLLLCALVLGSWNTPAMAEAPTYPCRIVQEFPHNPATYTQGLFIMDGVLYESSGRFGESFIAQVALHTGEHFRTTPLPGKYFAEGIVPLGDTLYLLTWLSGTGFTYTLNTLKQLGSFAYRSNGDDTEGWGLTHNGDHFIRSCGTDELHFHDSGDFSRISTLNVQDEGTPIRLINELEYVGGTILANIWKHDKIAVIDPHSGTVRAWIDLSNLRRKISGQAKSANGIAYDKHTGKLYVTGKYWDKLFEIAIDEVLWRQPVVAE